MPGSTHSLESTLTGCALVGLFATSLFAGQITSLPSEAQSREDRARELLKAGRLQEAEREFLQALALDPSRDEILLELAKLHIRGDSLAEAEKDLEEFLRAHPDSPLALGLEGEVKFRRKDFRGAQEYLKKVLVRAPNDGMAHKLLGLSYGAAGRWDLAQPHLDRAVAQLAKDEEAHYWRGRALLEAARYDDAIAEFRETLRLRPDYLRAYDNLGVCYDQLQKPALAIQHYRRAIELDRQQGTRYVWPYLNLGSLLNHLRRYEEAIQLLTPVVEWEPQSAALHYQLGRARLALEQYDAAERELLRATQLDSTLALPHYQLGRLYKLAGKPELARHHCEIFSRLAKPSQGNRSLY